MASTSLLGQFWAVGVGPGDPELLTLKAVRILQAAPVLYHPGPEAMRGRALDIVRPLLRPEQEIRSVLDGPMTAIAAADWKTSYLRGVEGIVAECRAGRDVVFLTEGDPTLHSTASWVWQLLGELDPEIRVEVVPGVSSVTAAAARVRWPLAQRDEIFAVVPASYHPERLASLLHDIPSVCLLKVPRALAAIQRALDELAGEREAVYVEGLGTSQEWLTYDLAQAQGRKGYFALVLVRPKRQARHAGRQAAVGRIAVVGLGPGSAAAMTRQALEQLRSADVIVGYEGYLRQLGSLGLPGELRGFPIGAERERATAALELGRAGRRVALVSSGDAGVYGMASLLLETAGESPGLEVEVVPGVTAAVAAAALLGAPLGNDFACVSLSDLLTPWPVIEQRLQAAGQGDFVLVLYNPVSRERTWQLPRTRELLLGHRRPETPVGIVQRAYRPGTRIVLTTLAELTSDGVDMETTLIIGNSRTRRLGDRLVTPRGYGESA